MTCDQCDHDFDAVAHRWRCPWCGLKAHCCEGEPLGVTEGAPVQPA